MNMLTAMSTTTTTTDLVHDKMLDHIEETREALYFEIARLRDKLDRLLVSNRDRDVVAGDGWGPIGSRFISCTAAIAQQAALEHLYFDLYPDSIVYSKARYEARESGY
jgi:hypothetical protein